MEFEPVIGFEVHCELKTESKVWCGCSTEFGAPPNTQVCPVCLGMPGTLPVLNEKAFRLALRIALALHCDVPEITTFDRKNYYYPDLPKNYQISQNDKFIGKGGFVEVDLGEEGVKTVTIDNIHLEEDAGKNIHPEGRAHVDYSLVDLNRAGQPLMEIVTNPDLHSRDEAEAFMKGMRNFLQYLEVSDCKMEEGSLRFELNISVREKGTEKLGTKVEIKNVNSITSVLKAIDAEIERQTELIEDGYEVDQETRLWDDVKLVTRPMRAKEFAQDYRYFPDPDLIDFHVTEEMLVEIRGTLPELPVAKRRRFVEELGLPLYDASVLTSQKELAIYFEETLQSNNNPKGISNWLMMEGYRWLGDQPEDTTFDAFPIPAGHLGEMVKMIDEGSITGKIAKKVYSEMLGSGKRPSVIVEEKGLKPLDESAIEPIIDEVLSENEAIVEQIRGGKEKAMGALIGQIMRKTQGKANPAVVTPMIRKKIGVK